MTKAVIESIDKYKPDVNVEPKDLWEKDFVFLVVAYGLSFIQTDEEYMWHETSYVKGQTTTEVAHPINEGMYIFDVLARAFSE